MKEASPLKGVMTLGVSSTLSFAQPNRALISMGVVWCESEAGLYSIKPYSLRRLHITTSFSISEFGLNNPTEVAVDSAGCLYVSEYSNNTIRELTPVGTNWVTTTLAGKGIQAQPTGRAVPRGFRALCASWWAAPAISFWRIVITLWSAWDSQPSLLPISEPVPAPKAGSSASASKEDFQDRRP